MKRFGNYLEAVALALLAGLLWGARELFWQMMDWADGPELWMKRGGVIRNVLAAYSAFFAAGACASWYAARRRATTLIGIGVGAIRSSAGETRSLFRWFYRAAQIENSALWLVAITAIGAVLRAYFLARPMAYDESNTFLSYVNNGFLYLFLYREPNNHVLHTLLVKLSVGLFGGHPVAIRLPAYLASVLAIPMAFGLSKLLFDGKASGLLASAAVALSPYLVLYGTNARGYSLVVLFSLCLAVLAIRMVDRPTTGLCFPAALLVALGLWVTPSFLFPATGLLCWASAALLKDRRPLWLATRIWAPCLATTAGLAAVFYTPTVIATMGLRAVVDNPFVRAEPWREFWAGLPAHLAKTANQFASGIPTAFLCAVAFLFVVGLCIQIKRGNWRAFALLPIVLIGSMALLVSKHNVPYPRVWIFLVPFILFVADAGLAAILNCAGARVKTWMLLGAGGCAVCLMSRDVVAVEDDVFPEVPALVKVLAEEMRPGDELIVPMPADVPVAFYMWHEGVPRMPPPSGGDESRKRYFIALPRSYPISRLTRNPVRQIVRIDDAELYVECMETDEAIVPRGGISGHE